MSEERKKPLFIESEICQSNFHCMNCRFSPVREKWFKDYEVPDDIREKCARGKTLEQIKEEHAQIRQAVKDQREEEEQLTKELQKDAEERAEALGPMPPVVERALNFGKAAARRTAAKARRKRVDVTNEVYEERYAICKQNKCGKMVVDRKGNERCGACGCPWKRKLKWATERCPLGYWENII